MYQLYTITYNLLITYNLYPGAAGAPAPPAALAAASKLLPLRWGRLPLCARTSRSTQGHTTTGHGLETWELLAKEPIALSSYALAYVAPTPPPGRSRWAAARRGRRPRARRRPMSMCVCV